MTFGVRVGERQRLRTRRYDEKQQRADDNEETDSGKALRFSVTLTVGRFSDAGNHPAYFTRPGKYSV
jgi:hypothetical protein